MLQSIKMIFRLWGQYAKMDLLWFLRDTRYCLLWIIADTVAAAASVSAVGLIASRFGGVGSMSSHQIFFLCGYAVLTDGIFSLFFGGNNTGYISRIIGRGQLDHMVIQPVPLWAQLLTGGFQPVSGSSKVFCGAALTAVSAAHLHLAVTPAWLAALIFQLLCSTMVVMAVDYIISCCAFFAPVAAEEISGTVFELFSQTKYYPLGGLSSTGALLFCTALPVGLAAWFPASVLLGKAPLGLPAAVGFIVSAAFCLIAVVLFRKGLSHYAKNGSVRYSGFGFR